MASSKTNAAKRGSASKSAATSVPIPSDLQSAISELSERNDTDIQLVDALKVAELALRSVKSIFASLDKAVYAESTMLAAYLDNAHKGLAKVASRPMHDRELPIASEELREVVKHAESATNTIMESAEAIMTADTSNPEEYAEAVQNHVLTIFEACSFQDITGQRINKVCDILTKLSEQMDDLSRTIGRKLDQMDEVSDEELSDRDKWRRENLINGPAMAEEAISQDEVDEAMGQDAIDSLFD